MKRIILIMLLFMPAVLFAQKSPADKVFEKYSGKEGYTSVMISKHLFGLFAQMNTEDQEFESIVAKLSSIKILSAEGSAISGVNFFTEIMKDLPLSDYSELMVVKEKGQDFKFLIREKDGKIQELLMVAGGVNSNALISILGDIDLQTISKLSKSMNIEGLDKIEKKDE
jgi:hypothetical protein